MLFDNLNIYTVFVSRLLWTIEAVDHLALTCVRWTALNSFEHFISFSVSETVGLFVPARHKLRKSLILIICQINNKVYLIKNSEVFKKLLVTRQLTKLRDFSGDFLHRWQRNGNISHANR